MTRGILLFLAWLFVGLETLGIRTDSDRHVVRVYLTGSLLSREDHQKLVETLIDYVKEGCLILLNLSGLRYMNSEGLGALVKLFTRVRREGGEMAVCGVNEILKQLFLITRLMNIFNVFERESEAMEWLQTIQTNSNRQV